MLGRTLTRSKTPTSQGINRPLADARPARREPTHRRHDEVAHRTPRQLAYFVGMTRFGSQVVRGGNTVHSARANSMVRKIGH